LNFKRTTVQRSKRSVEQLLKQLLERAAFATSGITKEIREAIAQKILTPVEARVVEIAVRELIVAQLQNNWLGLVSNGQPPKPKTEQEIMRLVASVIGVDCPDGMERNGAIWRTYIRGNRDHPPKPEKVVRVMYTVQKDVAEGKQIKTTVGRYALDLYKRFAG